MNKIIVLLILVLVLMSNAFSQDDFFLEYVNKYKVPENLAIEPFRYQYCFVEDDLYYLSDNPDSNCVVTLNCLSDTNKSDISLTIPSNLLQYKCNKNSIKITSSDGLIAVGIRNLILLYNRNQDNFELLNLFDVASIFDTKLTLSFDRIKLIAGKIIGFKDNYHAKYRTGTVFSCFEIDIKDSNNNQIRTFNEPEGFYWTLFQPRIIIDATANQILTTDITKYSIKIFDNKGEIKDSLLRNIPDWKAVTYPMTKFDGKHPTSIISYLQSDTTTTSLIHKAEFVNDSLIFVTYSIADEEETEYTYHEYHDLWTKKDGRWSLKQETIDGKELRKNKSHNITAPLNVEYEIFDGRILTFNFDYRDRQNNYVLIRRFKP
jgi:hypothetical protein